MICSSKKFLIITFFNYKLILTILVMSFVYSLNCQVSINSSGKDISSPAGSISYSLGQIDFNSYNSQTGSVSLGVQHAYEIFVTNLSEIDKIISLQIFPNPVIDVLSLELSSIENKYFNYQIYNNEGKLLEASPILSVQTLIQFKEHKPSCYFLNVVSDDNKVLKSFKIVKY